MNWTHLLAFGLGATWMLVVFVTASAMRTPGRDVIEDGPIELPSSWLEAQAHAASHYSD
jgi:hypothetical protein